MTSPRVNTLVVRPLVERFYDPDDPAIVYCLLANRVQFLREQSTDIRQSVSRARATLCELVATKVLRKFHEHNPGPAGLLLLANILVQGFDPFAGAPEDVASAGRSMQWPVQERGGNERKVTALELAIVSESKTLISSPACQRVVSAVYLGQVVYTPLSFVDILPDHYKHHPVSLYDPRRAPILNHYRLIVPRWRNILDVLQFTVLLALYILLMVNRNGPSRVLLQVVFTVYTAGWMLAEFAAVIEHGWAVYTQKTWSFLDVTFGVIFGAYLLAAVYDAGVGVGVPGRDGGGRSGSMALDILCVAAPVLLTRAAFSLMPDNLVFICLHAMMKDFLVLTFLTLWCVGGFFLALQWLIATGGDAGPRWYEIAKWLLWIWFGLDGTGIQESVQFHLMLGPALIIAFAFLGNTLFLTLLVAMLTNTFSRIVAAEAAEIRFRHAVLTFEGVKSDAIFAYPPPINIAALLVLLPLKLVVSPRRFHTIHVALARAFNLPALLIISLFEREFFRPGGWQPAPAAGKGSGPRSLLKWRFTGFFPHGDIQAVFEADAPPEALEEADELDGLSEMGFTDTDAISRASRDMMKPPPVVFALSNASRGAGMSGGGP
ncbi:hypothetical protein ESCO_001773 [Escovopsis weberi]|uniref:Calcium channel YVC1 n=1 Tax=Escovopsis weberi TaxID=150374 RepID=A0A0M9VWI6_ESCWE|nr:hypothetical protein ESCO_001773 [Escovopsis weberi]